MISVEGGRTALKEGGFVWNFHDCNASAYAEGLR